MRSIEEDGRLSPVSVALWACSFFRGLPANYRQVLLPRGLFRFLEASIFQSITFVQRSDTTFHRIIFVSWVLATILHHPSLCSTDLQEAEKWRG